MTRRGLFALFALDAEKPPGPNKARPAMAAPPGDLGRGG